MALPVYETRRSVQLLGSPQLVEGEDRWAIFDRTAQIIGMLALAPDHTLRRKFVAEVVWGDHVASLTNLRQAIARQRRNKLPIADLVDADASNLRLNTGGFDIDVLRILSFKGSDEEMDFDEVPIGEFLQGVEATNPEFEDWLRAARQRLNAARRLIAVRALEQATRYGRCDPIRFRERCEQLRAFDDGTGATEEQIKSARERLGLGVSLQVTPQQGVEPERIVPRVALLRPLIDTPETLPLESFVADIADGLSRFRSFATIAPFSSFAIVHDNLAEEAKRLQLSYVVETRVLKLGINSVLSVRLIGMLDARIVWASDFPLTAETLAGNGRLLSSTIALTLADNVEADLAQQERKASKPGAYLHFLAGRTQQLRGDLPALRRARNSFRAALRCDPGFSLAMARIAETLVIEWILRGGTDGELLSSSHQMAEQARNTDPGAAEAHWILGTTNLYRRDYELVTESFETAQLLAPHSADLLLNFADAMSHLDSTQRAENLFQEALDMNPNPPDRYWWFGASIALSCGEFSVAAKRCDRIIADEVAVGMRTTCYALDGQQEMAAAWAKQLREVLPGMKIAELADLMPGSADNALQRNYQEGLRIAGLS